MIEDETIIKELDSQFTVDSPVIPVKRNKSGTLSKNSRTIDPEDMTHLRTFVNKKSTSLGNGIVNGEISPPKPFVKKSQTACDYCVYKSVCGFDEKLPECSYNRHDSLSQEAYMDIIRKEV